MHGEVAGRDGHIGVDRTGSTMLKSTVVQQCLATCCPITDFCLCRLIMTAHEALSTSQHSLLPRCVCKSFLPLPSSSASLDGLPACVTLVHDRHFRDLLSFCYPLKNLDPSIDSSRQFLRPSQNP